MINLDIKYSFDYEKERIKSTLDKADWFIKNGYSKWIKLPEGKKLDEIEINTSTEDYLLNKVEEEYNEQDYIKTKNIINEQWFKFAPKLEKYFKETSLKQEDVYIIQLTKYGVGGSYNLPNKVILNFQNKLELALFKIPVHEIVHLSIQSFVEKYNVDHWVKERIVDLILEKITPELNIMQKLSIDTKPIDESFEKHYPNIEDIIKNI
ncbi:hypothetical protein KKG48_00090 [Patescibacteria group bacterium]|nr:hypothetical protein [Nanoarchaeota archaeon]MBU4479830.1 hypothetical protein [Patescibacteria group bacterium]